MCITKLLFILDKVCLTAYPGRSWAASRRRRTVSRFENGVESSTAIPLSPRAAAADAIFCFGKAVSLWD